VVKQVRLVFFQIKLSVEVHHLFKAKLIIRDQNRLLLTKRTFLSSSLTTTVEQQVLPTNHLQTTYQEPLILLSFNIKISINKHHTQQMVPHISLNIPIKHQFNYNNKHLKHKGKLHFKLNKLLKLKLVNHILSKISSSSKMITSSTHADLMYRLTMKKSFK
jgi:hypothetical protein